MFTTKCELIGSLGSHPWSAMFDQRRRVYGTNGNSPALNANMSGGLREIKILEVYFYELNCKAEPTKERK